MKYILFEKSAVEELINYRYLQSAEFEEGSNFALVLKGETEQLLSTKSIYATKSDDGYFFIGKEVTKTFLVIDIERTSLFNDFSVENTIQIIQKLFRFAVRYWNLHPFSSSERIIPDTNKVLVFPLQNWKSGAFRVTIEKDPDSSRMATRGYRQLLLAYKCGYDGASGRNDEPVLKNLRDAAERYILVSADARKKFLEDEESQQPVEKPECGLDIYEVCKVFSEGSVPYMTFFHWENKLTKAQKEFIFETDIEGPMRLQGPAGTGKTLSLILKAIYLLGQAEKTNSECKIIFFAHSKATQLSIRNIFDAISSGRWSESRASSQQSIEITTLHEYCIDKVVKIPPYEVLERDAMDSKELQYLAICDAYQKVFSASYKTYYPLLSKNLISFIKSNEENPGIVCAMLQHEFAVMIKGKAQNSLDKYRKLESLTSGLQAVSEDDKGFIYQIFSEYQDYLEKAQQYDTDDIVISAVSQLDSPLWRRRRKQDGYDFIFIDESHLFNANETLAFHHLTRHEGKYPIIFSIDLTQAIGDHGSNHGDFHFIYQSTNNNYQKELDLVFRCSQQITNLAMSITASGATLFGHFRNPYNQNAGSAFTEREESLCKKPEYLMALNDKSMIEYAIKCANELVALMKCSPSEVAIIAFSDDIYDKIKKALTDSRYIEIKQRGDLASKHKAAEEKSFVLSMPEYIGGLEFQGVILVGVDAGRVPPKTGEDISHNYLMYSSYNKLYVSVTRAKYQLVILGAKDFGVSQCLVPSINSNTIDVKSV